MKTQPAKGGIKWLVFATLAIMAETAVADDHAVPHYRFKFVEPQPAGLQVRKTVEMRVRGWQVGQRAWFGQTRVGNQTRFGFVYSNGHTVYQLNNRGLRVTRYF